MKYQANLTIFSPYIAGPTRARLPCHQIHTAFEAPEADGGAGDALTEGDGDASVEGSDALLLENFQANLGRRAAAVGAVERRGVVVVAGVAEHQPAAHGVEREGGELRDEPRQRAGEGVEGAVRRGALRTVAVDADGLVGGEHERGGERDGGHRGHQALEQAPRAVLAADLRNGGPQSGQLARAVRDEPGPQNVERVRDQRARHSGKRPDHKAVPLAVPAQRGQQPVVEGVGAELRAAVDHVHQGPRHVALPQATHALFA